MTNWNSILEENDKEKSFENFINAILNILNLVVHRRFTKYEKKTLDALYVISRHSADDAINVYNTSRKLYKSSIISAKREHNARLRQDGDNPPKAIWKIMNNYRAERK